MGLLRILFSFQGRINRTQYWLGSMLTGLFGVACIVFVISSTGMSVEKGKLPDTHALGAATLLLLAVPAGLALAWIGFALQVKRFHDRGRTGWLVLAPVILSGMVSTTLFGHIASGSSPSEIFGAVQPYLLVMQVVNLLFFVDLGCLGSVDGPNQYGDHPRDGGMPPAGQGGASGKPSPGGGSPLPAAAGLFSAQSAMDRAIAAQAQGPIRAAPMRALAPATAAPRQAPGGFGRRPAR